MPTAFEVFPLILRRHIGELRNRRQIARIGFENFHLEIGHRGDHLFSIGAKACSQEKGFPRIREHVHDFPARLHLPKLHIIGVRGGENARVVRTEGQAEDVVLVADQLGHEPPGFHFPDSHRGGEPTRSAEGAIGAEGRLENIAILRLEFADHATRFQIDEQHLALVSAAQDFAAVGTDGKMAEKARGFVFRESFGGAEIADKFPVAGAPEFKVSVWIQHHHVLAIAGEFHLVRGAKACYELIGFIEIDVGL